MPLNPNTFFNPGAESLATGRPASSIRVNANLINPLSHLVGRRMGIYTIAPTSAAVNVGRNWTSNGISGSYYKTHGLFLEDSSYDDVVPDIRCQWAGFAKDSGRFASTIHHRVEVTYLQAPQIELRAASLQIDVTQSLSTNATTTPDANSIEHDDIAIYFFGGWRRNVSNNMYRSAEFNGNFGDMGEYQFTTKDLMSINHYMQDTYRWGTNKASDVRTAIPDSENKQGVWRGESVMSVQTGSNTTGYTRTMWYIPSFTVYPSISSPES